MLNENYKNNLNYAKNNKDQLTVNNVNSKNPDVKVSKLQCFEFDSKRNKLTNSSSGLERSEKNEESGMRKTRKKDKKCEIVGVVNKPLKHKLPEAKKVKETEKSDVGITTNNVTSNIPHNNTTSTSICDLIEDYGLPSDESDDETVTIQKANSSVLQEDPYSYVIWDCDSPKAVKKSRCKINNKSPKLQKNFENCGSFFNTNKLMSLSLPSKPKERVHKKQIFNQEYAAFFLEDLRCFSASKESSRSQEQLAPSTDIPAVENCFKEKFIEDNSSVALSKNIPVAEKPSENEESYWSDDDLFKDNSFLIEATGNPEKFSQLSPSFVCESKSEPSHESSLSSQDLSVIPSTCFETTSSYTASSMPFSSFARNSKKPAAYSNTMPGNKVLVYNKFSINNTNSHSVGVKNNTSKSSEVGSKTPFKKCNSFHDSAKNTVKESQSGRFKLSSPLRKTMSSDFSLQSTMSQWSAGRSSFGNTVLKKNFTTEKPSVQLAENKKFSSSSEDVSFPEDDFLQILDSSAGFNNKETQMKPVPKTLIKTVNTHLSKVNTSELKASNLVNSLSPKNFYGSQASYPNKLNQSKYTVSTVSSAQGKQKPISNQSVQNTNQPISLQSSSLTYQGANTGKLGSSSVQSTSASKINIYSHNQNSNHDTKMTADVGANETVASSLAADSYLENAFDDSFLKDEALYESQISPWLDLVESQASQVQPSQPVHCSPNEIEKKRQAALSKLRERNCR